MRDAVVSRLDEPRMNNSQQFRVDNPLLFDQRLVLWRVFQVALVGIAYYLSALLGLHFAIPPGNATAVWPASGVALAALLLGSRWNAAGIWLAACLINFQTGVGGPTAAWIATGNTVSALIAAALCVKLLDAGLTIRSLREPFLW